MITYITRDHLTEIKEKKKLKKSILYENTYE